MSRLLHFSRSFLFNLSLGAWATLAGAAETRPISLHPDNPHYFFWRGQPTLLVASTEHYGAVLNLDFDYLTYLNTIQAEGMNLTRVVPGTLVEDTGSSAWRGADQNPLAPRPGKYLAPWARSGTPGYYSGGNKFDLDGWDEAFFRRLKDFVQAASERGIVVEFNLLYVLYGDGPEFGCWVMHPLNARNNINNVGHGKWHRYNTLDEPALVARQEAVVRKLVTELNAFDNVIYEICDEPFLSGASPAETAAWQNRMLDVFEATRRQLPQRQLVGVNVANGYARAESLHPAVDFLNFHYCNPPAAAPLNYSWNKPLGFDETPGNRGTQARERRSEAWAWFFSGGALYNNLDPSFATDDPTGSGKIAQEDGTFDGRPVRAQLRVLMDFMATLDFVRMRPAVRLLHRDPQGPAGPYALENPGRQYAVYFTRPGKANARFIIDLPVGRWRAEWINPRTGATERTEFITHGGGGRSMDAPAFTEDIALRLTVSERQ
jgi:hypothetical protein